MAEVNDSPEAAQAPAPGSDEYNQQMAARFQNQGKEVTGAEESPREEIPAMPEGGAEKFYDADTGTYNWQAHAREAEYRLNQNKTEPAADKPAEEADADTGNDDAQKTAFAKAGLSEDTLRQELNDKGEFTTQTREALNKLGINDETLGWIQSMHSYAAEKATGEALDLAGGEQAWQAKQTWAQQNLSEAEQAELDTRLAGPNWKNAIADLNARYSAAEGNPKALKDGDKAPAAQGYTHRDQMKRDMQDPRYHKDPDFRSEVYQKIKRASFQNSNQ